ncbi:DUF2017 domain-containing protein [Rhodococcus rhodnii]|uniref:Uncharacterized protein n=2 Tax=Rhodococcus rhodnii TaxID=38312 RepID=R7WIX1_9NOCA|nr:DUF2017 domain-containing protein [Rhodococcus rhodnii]EOM75186.1 hypothetical protein Rrhod_3521 [Rhodococcus rhodnii LMG 5362]TXG91614.1 DUF2017 domain-containing protein [Rhodococcus rhodnii]
MRQWTRKNSLGGVKLRSEMDEHEATVLRSLVGSVAGLLDERAHSAPHDDLAELTGIRSGHSTAPEDAVLARLLPDFHRPDSEGADPDGGGDLNGALRSLHEPEIIDAKRAAAGVVLATMPSSGGKLSLTPEQADAWLAAINDVRLAIGTDLTTTDEDGGPGSIPDEYDPGDPRAAHYDVYHWLTWMQESLVQALVP